MLRREATLERTTQELVRQLASTRTTLTRLEADLRNLRREFAHAVAEAKEGRTEARELAERHSAELLEHLRDAQRTNNITPESPREQVVKPPVTIPVALPPNAEAADRLSGTEPESALLRVTLRDLREGSTGLRLVALERLAGMPPRLAATVYAAALSHDFEPEVLAHLCRVAGRCGVRSLLPLLRRHAAHHDDRVRMAVQFALRRLADDATNASSADAPQGRASFEPQAVPVAGRALTPDRTHEIGRRWSGNVHRQHPGQSGHGAPPAAAVRGGRLREIEHELRRNLRGLTPDALRETLSLSRHELDSALDAAISSGRIVRRGPRYFAS
jgi:hypothetical protein